jgi:hypothetical protein
MSKLAIASKLEVQTKLTAIDIGSSCARVRLVHKQSKRAQQRMETKEAGR